MKRLRPNIDPGLLRWAVERSGKPASELEKRFPKLEQWEDGSAKPTLKQLEAFAKATYTPVGYFFLTEPPVEQIPIPDFRTVRNQYVGHPSPNLLETIYICQQRQAWFREFARTHAEPPVSFAGAATLKSSVPRIAQEIRETLDIDIDARRQCSTWTDALRLLIAQADAAGIMVMCSGVVGNNNRRNLDPAEFRGFALVDEYAPLIFVNGADTKSAQMFTVVHELAHIWLGESALSDTTLTITPDNRVEAWCNQVAAEVLVPIATIKQEFNTSNVLESEISRLARRFKVSTLVIIRRIHDAGRLDYDTFQSVYDAELQQLLSRPKGSGGNFYLTQGARASKRFARALILDTLEGQTLFRDAQQLLGINKMNTFKELGRELSLPV